MPRHGDNHWLEVIAGGTAGAGTAASKIQGSSAAAAADAGNPVKVGGVYLSSPTTVTNGQRTNFLTDEYGQLKVVPLGTVAAAPTASASGGYSFSNITTATTTTVKSGAGYLRRIVVNTKGTVASAIVIYDNAAGSGTKIATIDSLNLYGTFTFDIAFATGLTLVTTGTAAPDVTVIYK